MVEGIVDVVGGFACGEISGPEGHGHETFDRLADDFVSVPSEQEFGLAIDDPDGAILVGDDEGEPEPIAEPATPKLASIGRGRGTALPAWMTQHSDGPSGGKGANHSDPEEDTRTKKKEKDHDRKKKKKSHHHQSKI